jgi:hydroxymethylbilane synthase
MKLPDGVEVVAYTRRRTPFAAFLTYDGIILDEFESGAVIGVEGPGQAAQLIHYRPELRVVVMRGGAQQRLQRLEDGEIDALVVPAAWAEWLHIEDRVSEILSVDVIVPAAGQGSLCLLGRSGETTLDELGKKLNDRIARREIETERRAAAHLTEGGIHIAAALAQQHGERMELDAMAIDAGGRHRIHRTVEGDPTKTEALARGVADEILAAWKREE